MGEKASPHVQGKERSMTPEACSNTPGPMETCGGGEWLVLGGPDQCRHRW